MRLAILVALPALVAAAPAAALHDAGGGAAVAWEPPEPEPLVQWRRSVSLGEPAGGRLVRGVELPAEGEHFFSWDPLLHRVPNRAGRRWGSHRLVRLLLRIVAEYAAAHPEAPRVGIGDLSRRRGGPFGPVHATHQNGLDADVYYPRRDGAERPPLRVSQIDRRLAQDLLDRFVAAGVDLVYVGPNTGFTGPRGVVQVLWNHDNHLHVRIRATTRLIAVRKVATWLLVGAVAALGLAAAVDSLRPEPERIGVSSEPTTTAVESAARRLAIEQLREAGIRGVLTYSNEECRLSAVSLPELEPVRAPSYQMCRPATKTGGLGAVDGEVVWAGLGYGFAQVVLSRDELARELGRELGTAPYRARQAASLTRGRYAVLAEGGSGRVVAIFEGKRLHGLASLGLDAGLIRPSPRGRYLAILSADRGVLVADLDGRGISLPDGAEPHAIAWSPDDRWTVLATEAELFVFPTGRTGGPLIGVPLAVRDLDWGE